VQVKKSESGKFVPKEGEKPLLLEVREERCRLVKLSDARGNPRKVAQWFDQGGVFKGENFRKMGDEAEE
jgi:hypothetical protein